VTFNERIYRINGHCGTERPGLIGDSFRAVWNTTNKPAWKEGIKLYNESLSSESEISFAWENRTNTLFQRKALTLLSNVSDIIVIGYSFPYFNREIDKLIFQHLSPTVQRIYLQYPKGEHSSIEERIKVFLDPNIDIIRIDGIDLFYIPNNF